VKGQIASVKVLAVCVITALGALSGCSNGTTGAAPSIIGPSPTGSPTPVAQSVVNTTTAFLPGMRVTTPSGWTVGEDSQIELKLYPPAQFMGIGDSTGIRFWIDPHASTPCSDKALPVSIATPARAVAWLQGDKDLLITNLRHVTIAGHVGAMRLDLDNSLAAPKCQPDCKVSCIDYFLFRAGGETAPYGTGRGELVRLYFATIGPPTHTLVVGLDAQNKRVFDRLSPSLASIVASLQLPQNLPP